MARTTILFKAGSFAIREYNNKNDRSLPPKGTVVQFVNDVKSNETVALVKWLDSHSNQYKNSRVYTSTLRAVSEDLSPVFRPDPSFEKNQRLTLLRAYGHLSEREVVEYLGDDGERANVQAVDGTYWVPLMHLAGLTSEKVGTLRDANSKLHRHLRHDWSMAMSGLDMKNMQIEALEAKINSLTSVEETVSLVPAATGVKGPDFPESGSVDPVVMDQALRLVAPVDLTTLSPTDYTKFLKRLKGLGQAIAGQPISAE